MLGQGYIINSVDLTVLQLQHVELEIMLLHSPIPPHPTVQFQKATAKLIDLRVKSSTLLIRNGAMIVVFLILMLKKLAHVAKLFRAWSTVVRELRNALTITVATISQLRHHVLIHLTLLLSKLVDLCASIVGSAAPSTEATLDMLATFANRIHAIKATRNSATFDPLILAIVAAIIETATIRAGTPDAVSAARIPVTLPPLVVGEVLTIAEIATISAISSHCSFFLSSCYLLCCKI
jgi:hypothetical protein